MDVAASWSDPVKLFTSAIVQNQSMATTPSERHRATRRRGVFTVDPLTEEKIRCAEEAIDVLEQQKPFLARAEAIARKEIEMGLQTASSPWLLLFIIIVIIVLSIFVRMVVLRFSKDERRLLDYAKPTLNNIVFSFVLVMVGQMLLSMLSSTSAMAAAIDAERLNLLAVREGFASMPSPWNRMAVLLSTVPSVASKQIQTVMGTMDKCGVQFPSRDYIYPLIDALSQSKQATRVQYNVLARTDQNALLSLAVLLFITFSLFSLSRSTPEGAIFAVSLLAAAVVSIILIVQSQRSALLQRVQMASGADQLKTT